LQAGKAIQVLLDALSLVVKSEAAAAQFAKDEEAQKKTEKETGSTGGTSIPKRPGSAPGLTPPPPPPPPPKLSRFHGSVHADPIRLGRDASRIADEMVQHLVSAGAQVEVTIEIRAELPDGASDKLVRDVTENCRTLKFDPYGFEER